jgi:peptidoglycan/LPS O-acetylase OafA/YrhL
LCSLLLLIFLVPEVFRLKSADLPLFFSNLFLLHGWNPSWHVYFSYNASSWSISTEMFFYICFPLLLWGMNKRWYVPLAVTASVLALLIGFVNFNHLPEADPVRLSYQGLLFVNPLSSVFLFATGMTIAMVWRNHLSKLNYNKTIGTALELTAIAAVCLIYFGSPAMRFAALPWAGAGGAYWIQNSGLSVLGFAFLILTFAMEKGWISKLLCNSFLVLLGELSFGIYVLHGALVTFFAVNFPQQQSLDAALRFIVILCFSAHLICELVEKPMRKILMKKGRAFFDAVGLSKGTESRKPTKDNASTEKKSPVRRRLLIAGEAAALATFVYFTLPTIHRITEANADELAKTATVRNVALAPYMVCKSASAVKSGDKIQLAIVWEALSSENVDFTVTVTASDAANQPLAATNYCQDGRKQRVNKGTRWLDEVTLSVDPNAAVKSVSVNVLRKKHEVLHATGSSPLAPSLLVPVN